MTEKPDTPVRVRDDVLAVPAYRQGAAPSSDGFKLSSNENPFDPLPSVLASMAEASTLNRYAAAAMTELRSEIAAAFEASRSGSETGDPVTAEHVHLGAGSVAILYQLVHAVAGAGDEVVYAWPSFEAYPALTLVPGARSVPVPLTDTYAHDLDAMADAITPRTRAVLLCTPNNPTGPAISREDFDRFMQRVPVDTLVVLDEAYREFVTDGRAVRGEDVLHAHPNLAVLRTFSKAYGLAALRIGYGIGHPALWQAAAVTQIPLSVTGLAEVAARASLAPAAQAENNARVTELCARRDRLVADLRALGIHVPDAQGNFVWIPEANGIDAMALAAAFTEAGTLVRPFAGHGVRISVGEAESLDVVTDIVRENLSSGALQHARDTEGRE